jgi:2-oxoisovalerate dehydrogenase E1 component
MKTESIQRTYNRLDLLKLMYLSREGDRREGILLRQSKGWFQVSGMGHEALAVLSYFLEPEDYLFPYYRDRALVLARGITNAQLATAYFAKIGSSSAGRQMPGHFSDRSLNIWSVPTPTGANCLPACGVAWSMQLKGLSQVALATVGDAAARQGEVAEAIAFSLEKRLPIVFVVEDNHYGISTNTEKFNPFRLGVFDESYLLHLDARHPDRVYEMMGPVFEKARSGGGPTVVVASLDRLCSHTSSDDHRVYRSKEEIEEMMKRDPIENYAQELIAAGELTEEHWREIQSAINQQVDREYIAAETEVDPTSQDLMIELWGDPPEAVSPPIRGGRRMRLVDSLNELFRQGLKTFPDMVMFGEDIEAPKGGVFGLTADLSHEFPTRVFNSPLAEATIAGVGIGMACFGMKPVFEFQFIDFVGPAMNQIGQNLATLRWRTNGDWQCPVIFYAPYGAYLPGGSLWHSQCNESIFAHFPGIRILVPSTPEDATGLMWTALHSEDPCLFLLPKHLFRQPVNTPENFAPVGFGEARIRQEGSDVTLVTWGNCTELAFSAANRLQGVAEIEIIDLRSIQPWDRHTVTQSLKKTGRLVVVQEDGRSCSVGQMIISDLVSKSESFHLLISPPELVSKPDVPIGYNPVYEYSALPDVDRVVAAINATLED